MVWKTSLKPCRKAEKEPFTEIGLVLEEMLRIKPEAKDFCARVSGQYERDPGHELTNLPWGAFDQGPPVLAYILSREHRKILGGGPGRGGGTGEILRDFTPIKNGATERN